MRASSRYKLLAGGTAAVAAVLAAVLVASTAGAAPAPTPGAPGIGDPYFPGDGNGGYDVQHYDIDVSYQPTTDDLAGTTTIAATATQDLSQFDLDFLLQVSAVRVNGVSARFTGGADGELVVVPARPLPKHRRFTVAVTYADRPGTRTLNGVSRWRRIAEGGLAATQPEIAQWWFPSDNHPLDKATFDVSITVPAGFQAVSSGFLVGGRPQQRPAGATRWHWRTNKQQAPYLTLFAAGKYQIEQSSIDGIPVVNAYADDLDPDQLGNARAAFANLPAVVRFEESLFGPYPFDALGGVVIPPVGRFAEETQTRPVYRADFLTPDGSSDQVMAHMIASQWFGGSISFPSWNNFVMDDMITAYLEAVYLEHLGLVTAADVAAAWQFDYDLFPADDPFWLTEPGDPGPTLDSLVTQTRGGETMQVLRNTVGDETFFAILRAWANSDPYGHGSIEQFIQVCDRVSGRDLRQLFDVWLFTPAKPAVGPSGTATPAAARATARLHLPLLAGTTGR